MRSDTRTPALAVVPQLGHHRETVEAIAGKGLVSSDNTERLKRLFNHSGKILVEYGHSLLEVLMRGTSLVLLVSKLLTERALNLAETIGYLPLLCQGHYVMAKIYRDQGKPQEAAAEYKKAKEIIRKEDHLQVEQYQQENPHNEVEFETF